MKILFLILFLVSCHKKEISYNYPDNPDYARQSRAGTAFSKGDMVVFGDKKNDFSLFGKDAAKKNEAIAIKPKSPLFISAAQIIGDMFPIAILDSDSGIITTEWYQESAKSNERIKLNVLIKGVEPVKKNLQITIFRQKRLIKKNSMELWEDLSRENSDSGGIITKMLQEKILQEVK